MDCHMEKRSITGGVDDCGDTGLIRVYDGYCFMALIDALGHGKGAHETAIQAEAFLSTRYDRDLIRILNGLHLFLAGTRGVAAGVCRLDLNSGVLSYAGIGNICMRIFGPRYRRLVNRNGVVGYIAGSPRQQQTSLSPGDIFVMSSDGVKEHFDPACDPGILEGNARDICREIMNKLGKNNDDVSCIALRYGI